MLFPPAPVLLSFPPMETPSETSGTPENPARRDLLAFGAMAAGLTAGYGLFGWMGVRYLYPSDPKRARWIFVRPLSEVRVGEAFPFRTPSGATVTLARLRNEGTDSDFLALSDTCPHLGCKVRWEAPNNRFFCPCHNGVFDPSGKATEGPPAEAGQSLLRYPLKVEDGLLYIEVSA